MAHGLGGTRNASLEPYAERFAAAGFYVLLFDYRYLGDSDGEPRQLISIPRQLEDWKSAIAFARDHARRRSRAYRPVGLLAVGRSRDRRRRARHAHRGGVGAMSDARRACQRSQGSQAGRIWQDRPTAPRLRCWTTARAAFGLSPYYVPLVAPPGELAAMPTPDAYEGLKAIVPPGWRNEVAARLFLRLPFYRPIRYAREVACPTLIIACERDTVVSPEAAAKAAERTRRKGAARHAAYRSFRDLSRRMVRALEPRAAGFLPSSARRLSKQLLAINSGLMALFAQTL